jgi:predicted signal transduction protein with EAL and GGDEF domain
MTTTEAKTAGMVRVCEWGITSYDQGYIYAAPADVTAVRAAVDAADDANPDLTDVTAAGGVYIRD